jgi:hypothetical protein
LFICAKNLLLEAMASTGPGTTTFEIDQNFEPGARTRRPTVVGAALKMSASSMSDEFDGLDATEKAGIGATLNRCRALATKIANELRNKRPEDFIDKLSLADVHASLERAADVLSTVKGSQDPIGYPKNAGPCPKKIKPVHRETLGLMLTNFRVGDRVEDKETHKRGRVTFVYSKLELKGEVIAVLFDGRDEALAVSADSVRKVSTRQS